MIRVTYECIDILRGTNWSAFTYEVENEVQALELFEAEAGNRYEINDITVEEL